MRTVPNSILNSLVSLTRTVKAKLYISRQRSVFDINLDPFGTGQMNVSSNISIDTDDCWYDAQLIPYYQGSEKRYVILRAVTNSDGYLCYWVYDTAGRNTNGWIVSNSNLGSYSQTSLSINPHDGSIYFVRNNSIYRRQLYYNDSWNLTSEEFVRELPSGSRYRIVHTNNPALRYIVMGEYNYSYPRDYIYAEHGIRSYHPSIEDQNIGSTIGNNDYVRTYLSDFAPRGMFISAHAYTVYDTFDAEWIEKPIWHPENPTVSYQLAKYGKDVLVIYNSVTKELRAVSIRPGFVGGTYSFLNNDPSLDDVYLLPFDIKAVGDDVFMLGLFAGLSNEVFCLAARNVNNRPMSFDIPNAYIVGGMTTSDAWHNTVKLLPVPDLNMLIVFPISDNVFVAPYDFSGNLQQIEFGAISDVKFKAAANGAMTASVVADYQSFMSVLSANNITDPRFCVYTLSMEYDGAEVKLGEFLLDSYTVDRSPSGEGLSLSLVSRGMGSIGNMVSPFSYEVIAPDIYSMTTTGDTDEKRAENFYKDITVTNGAFNLVGSVAEAANNEGSFLSETHPLHRCAMCYFNTSGGNNGFLEISMSRTNSNNSWGILARYTLEASGTTVYHRGLLFRYNHSEQKWKIYFMDTRRTNPLQYFGEVSHPSAEEETVYFYNPYPGLYQLYNVSDNQLNQIFSVYIPEYYSNEYSLNPRGYYGLCLWRYVSGEDTSSPYLRAAYFTPLGLPQSVMDALVGICYYSGAKNVQYGKKLDGIVNDYTEIFGQSLVFDGVIYPSPSASKIVIRTVQDDPWEKLEVYRDQIVTHKYTYPINIAEQSIKKVKIFGNSEMFAVYVEETPYLVIRNEDSTSPMRVIADDAYLLIKDASIQVDSNLIDVGASPFQHLAQYLQERWIALRDDQNGGVRVYQFWGDTYNLYTPNQSYGLNNASQITHIYTALPFTHVRVFSDIVRDVIDVSAMSQYGYRLQVVNAETLLGPEQTYLYGKNIILDSISRTRVLQAVLPFDPRIEAGDVVRFSDDDIYYFVDGYSGSISQRGPTATAEAAYQFRPRPNYLEYI